MPATPLRQPRVVVVTAAGRDTFSQHHVERLQAAADVTFCRRTERMSPAELAAVLADADYAALTPRTLPPLDAAAVARLPRSLKGIAVFATGVDFADLDALERRGIVLCNLPDYSAISVAEHTLGLMLALSRRIHLSRDRVMGRVPPGTSVRGWELHGKTVGVVGVGRIGSRVARLAAAFGMRVIACDPRRPVADLEYVDLPTLLSESDVVTLHLPTRWNAPPLIGMAELRRMRPGAVLVNVARADLVDESAVVRAIAAGHLRGYAVDDILRDRVAAARLVEEGRIVETGHTAWYSQEALDRGYEEWVRNVIALAEGAPRNVVRREAAEPARTAWLR